MKKTKTHTHYNSVGASRWAQMKWAVALNAKYIYFNTISSKCALYTAFTALSCYTRSFVRSFVSIECLHKPFLRLNFLFCFNWQFRTLQTHSNTNACVYVHWFGAVHIRFCNLHTHVLLINCINVYKNLNISQYINGRQIDLVSRSIMTDNRKSLH